MSMIINDKRQRYYGEIKARFYLRKPKASRPSKIYLVVFIEHKQYRCSTGVKVYPNQWNSKKELAMVSNTLSKQDNQNNMIANERLAKVRRYFAEFIKYLCENDVTDIVATLKQFIYQDAAKANFDPYATIMDALYHYHNYVKPSIKDSTKRQSESLLSEFARFVGTLPEKDKTMEIFSQSGLNMNKEYLINKMNKSKVGDTKRNFGVGQLNRCGAIIALLINKVLVPKEEVSNPVVWIKVEDPRREDQVGHIPLLDEEVTAIENCIGRTPVEEEYPYCSNNPAFFRQIKRIGTVRLQRTQAVSSLFLISSLPNQ